MTGPKPQGERATQMTSSLMDDRRNIFPLEELARSLRDEIYRHALVAESPVEIRRHKHTIKPCSNKCKDCSTCSLGKRANLDHPHRLEVYVRSVFGKRMRFGRAHAAVIRLMNRTMYDEASTVLVKDNKFVFLSPGGLEDFRHNFRVTHFAYIQDFEAHGVDLRREQAAFKRLRLAHNLTRLEIVPQNNVSESSGAQAIADLLVPLLFKRIEKHCTCGGTRDGQCICMTKEQHRVLRCVTVRGYSPSATELTRGGNTMSPQDHLRKSIKESWRQGAIKARGNNHGGKYGASTVVKWSGGNVLVII